jgi:hypothetical protein
LGRRLYEPRKALAARHLRSRGCLDLLGEVRSGDGDDLPPQDGILTNDAEIAWTSRRASTASDDVRKWELGGFKETPSLPSTPYGASSVGFIGWQDGRGPGDCEPLERAYSQTTESWGTQAIYSLGGGWAELLNSN